METVMGNDLVWALQKTCTDYTAGARLLVDGFVEWHREVAAETLSVCPGKNPFCILAISPIVVLGGTVSKNGSAFVQAIQAKKYGRAALHAVGVMGAFIPPGMGGAVAGSSQPTLAMVTPGGAVFAGIAAESTSISAVHVAAAGILMSATGASGEWDGFLKLGQAELEARLKAQYGEEVWVFERIDPHFDLTRIPEGAYKYVVVEKEGFRQLRIGVGKATTEHHDLVLAGENVVGAGKLVYTRSSKGIRIVIDGSSGGYPTRASFMPGIARIPRHIPHVRRGRIPAHPYSSANGLAEVKGYLESIFAWDKTTVIEIAK